MAMINGKKFYFFRLEIYPGDEHPEYRIGESIKDLYLRFGYVYLNQFYSITQLDEVTVDHVIAFNNFLLQQVSNG